MISSMKATLFVLYCSMLAAVVTGRESIGKGGGAAGSPNRNPNPNNYSINSNTSTSTITSTNSNKPDTSYNSGGSNNYSQIGVPGRVAAVSCSICSGDGYNPNVKISNGWSCGYLQETVQDVDANSQWDDERKQCRLTQLKAEGGGCCPNQTISSQVSNPNGPCSLCGAGSVPVSQQNILTATTLLGRHSCGGLADAMNSGILSANLCPAVIAQAGSTCCISGRSGSLRGATPDMASDMASDIP